jgi:hypothetical protein
MFNYARKNILRSQCKECQKLDNKKYHTIYSMKNSFKEEAKERAALWRKTNRDKYLNSSKEYRKSHPEKIITWRNNNPKKIAIQAKKARKKRMLIVKNKINRSISGNMLQSLRKGCKNGRHWESLVGYTIQELMVYLESKFTIGMNWENYGRNGWHIDHIIPVSVFNFESTSDIDFKRCWELSNLQPMWESENIIKRAKLEHPFQPSLAISL